MIIKLISFFFHFIFKNSIEKTNPKMILLLLYEDISTLKLFARPPFSIGIGKHPFSHNLH